MSEPMQSMAAELCGRATAAATRSGCSALALASASVIQLPCHYCYYEVFINSILLHAHLLQPVPNATLTTRIERPQP